MEAASLGLGASVLLTAMAGPVNESPRQAESRVYHGAPVERSGVVPTRELRR
jgi:hypothetical protein